MARLIHRSDLTIAVIVLLFAVQAVIRYRSHLDPDVAWYLYAGGRLLDGAALYEDIVEINPPLGLWLCSVIVAVTRELGVDPAVFLKTMLFLVTAASLAVSARFLAAEGTPATQNVLIVLVAALMLFLPGAEFGQRDHIAILLVTPWVLLRWNRLLDRNVPWHLAAAVGVGAALAIWMKPHFVFVLISIEITMLFATRRVRTILAVETMAIIVFGVVYMALIRTMWSSTLLTAIALYGSRAYIPFYGIDVETVVARLGLPFVLAAVAVASASLLTARFQHLRTLLFVAGVTFVCAFVLQAGKSYQTMPALAFLVLAAGLGVARVLAGEVRLSASRRSLAVVVVSAAAIVVVLVSALSNQFVRYQGHPFEEAIMAEAPDARIVFIASTNVADSFPLVTENRLVWASRFPSLWFSPYVATKLDDKSGPSDDIARFVLDATISDLVEFKPDIVFVDQAPTRPAYREAPLDYLVFWDADPRFRGFWKSYEQRGSIGDFGIFVRTVPSPGSELTPGSARDVDRADPFGCILAEVLDSFC